mmetsp:Transcript_64498/g.154019  ORF Transcript_64498/g.154019 Transcript_64498/m.154019 type:complete len:647 (+) Transcript_64498:124-2064(+)
MAPSVLHPDFSEVELSGCCCGAIPSDEEDEQPLWPALGAQKAKVQQRRLVARWRCCIAILFFMVVVCSLVAVSMPTVFLPGVLLGSSRVLVIRYSVLADDRPLTSLGEVADDSVMQDSIRSLLSSMCSVHAHLEHPLQALGWRIAFLVYTNSRSHAAVATALSQHRSITSKHSRLVVVNLDADQDQADRRTSFSVHVNNLRVSDMDFRTYAELQTFLADTGSTSWIRGDGLLLLGVQFEFVRTPTEFLQKLELSEYQPNVVAYLSSNLANYSLAGYEGPQCAGLLEDFVFIGEGAPFSFASASDALIDWADRVDGMASDPTWLSLSRGEKGNRIADATNPDRWAQFAWSKFLGNWSNGTCEELSDRYLPVPPSSHRKYRLVEGVVGLWPMARCIPQAPTANVSQSLSNTSGNATAGTPNSSHAARFLPHRKAPPALPNSSISNSSEASGGGSSVVRHKSRSEHIGFQNLSTSAPENGIPRSGAADAKINGTNNASHPSRKPKRGALAFPPAENSNSSASSGSKKPQSSSSQFPSTSARSSPAAAANETHIRKRSEQVPEKGPSTTEERSTSVSGDERRTSPSTTATASEATDPTKRGGHSTDTPAARHAPRRSSTTPIPEDAAASQDSTLPPPSSSTLAKDVPIVT